MPIAYTARARTFRGGLPSGIAIGAVAGAAAGHLVLSNLIMGITLGLAIVVSLGATLDFLRTPARLASFPTDAPGE